LFGSNPFSEIFPQEKRITVSIKLELSSRLSGLINEHTQSEKFKIAQSHIMFMKFLQRIHAGNYRATVLHREIDTRLNQNVPEITKPITCKKGCAFCCHRMVFVNADEADLLTTKLEQLEGGKISNKTIAKLENITKAYSDSDTKKFWKLPYHQSRCIFLDTDNTCKVYESRPASCRLKLVTSPAENCSKEKSRERGNVIQNYYNLPIEVYNSAATILHKDNYTAMPHALLREINYRKINPLTEEERLRKDIEKLDSEEMLFSYDRARNLQSLHKRSTPQKEGDEDTENDIDLNNLNWDSFLEVPDTEPVQETTVNNRK